MVFLVLFGMSRLYTLMACLEVLYCYGLPGLLWNVDSFILLWPAWFHVEWERFHPVSLEVVELWSVILWNWESCGLLFSETGRVVVCYSLKLGEFSSFIKSSQCEGI